tara:strand:- start:3237 stop:3365 length:129 start_codon:yes stop_codon:yes gene_type:complete
MLDECVCCENESEELDEYDMCDICAEAAKSQADYRAWVEAGG